MRVLLSGIVGAAASAAGWFYLEHVTRQEMGWLAIAVGIVTGVCVNAAAGPARRESFGRAILAVVLSLGAIVGGQAVYADVMQHLTEVKELAGEEVPVVVAPQGDAAGEGSGDAEEMEEPVVALEMPAGGEPGIKMEKPPINRGSALDMVWMGVAALAAYVTGKGRNVAAPAEQQAAEPDAESGSAAPSA